MHYTNSDSLKYWFLLFCLFVCLFVFYDKIFCTHSDVNLNTMSWWNEPHPFSWSVHFEGGLHSVASGGLPIKNVPFSSFAFSLQEKLKPVSCILCSEKLRSQYMSRQGILAILLTTACHSLIHISIL